MQVSLPNSSLVTIDFQSFHLRLNNLSKTSHPHTLHGWTSWLTSQLGYSLRIRLVNILLPKLRFNQSATAILLASFIQGPLTVSDHDYYHWLVVLMR